LREEALNDIHKAMTELDPSAGREEALLLLRGALVAINRAIKDNVFAVRALLSFLDLLLKFHLFCFCHFALVPEHPDIHMM
jgi:hypothetical protein